MVLAYSWRSLIYGGMGCVHGLGNILWMAQSRHVRLRCCSGQLYQTVIIWLETNVKGAFHDRQLKCPFGPFHHHKKICICRCCLPILGLDLLLALSLDLLLVVARGATWHWSSAPAHESWPGRGRLHLHPLSGTAAAAVALQLFCNLRCYMGCNWRLDNRMDMVVLDSRSGGEERKRLTSTRVLYRSTHTTQSKASAEAWPIAQASARHPCHPLSNIHNNIPSKIIRNRHPPRQDILICIFTLL